MPEENAAPAQGVHTLSVVVPVYQGEKTLAALVDELLPWTTEFTTPDGHRAVVEEILLVDDNGPDRSGSVIRTLSDRHEVVRPVWLSRNYGQHPATLAGMASSGGDWIITMDEDGQHDPSAVPGMLDVAMRERADVVYGRPVNAPPHGLVRNVQSRAAKRLVHLSSGSTHAGDYQSFRLVLGGIGRSVAAYAGAGVYLDVALGWVARRVVTAPVTLRAEGDRPSGYRFRTLMSHFWRMVITSGTGALRLVSILGGVFAVGGGLLAIYLLAARLFWDSTTPAGWPSLMVVLLVCSGAILFSLGVIAEYIGTSVNMAMGKPLYLIVTDPDDGPLGRTLPPVPPAAPAPPTADRTGARTTSGSGRP
ncbi:glycosyltransferase [Nakamurella sp. YIM 132087]|uniref:Glycosyltransferase n=1 Tax=Nakamurella alba TaxID=2665158 RepID=A0A7K1FIZ4_9ACTN|nr:glycosyltransferase [Nakamurella alba]MTD14105.1 glycosyltransferase [Nakamurella alba]